MLGKEEMHKNTFKPLCMLAAITLAFGISTSSAHAADTDLSITQKIDKITGKESQQKYTINYTGENKNTALKIEYDRGFYAKELKVGDWDNYTGKIKVTAYTKDTKSPVMTTEADENATVSLENYSNIDWIEMNPAGDDGTQEDMTETQNIKDVDLSGTIYAGKSGKTVQVKGSVWLDDTYSGNAVCEKVITTTANDYTVASPYVQVNPDQVNYLGSTAMTIKNLQGSLKAGQLNSYHVTFNIPARMFVDSITLPKFDNASYKLYVNGNQMDTRNSKIYVNDKAANISMDITPNGDFFSQSQDMVIDMRNTVNQSGDNKVSVSVLAVCGNGCEFKADSNAMPIKYQEQTVTPSEPDTPETPSEPEQPDTPETPTLPDTTGTDTKKNNHQTTVKKNNTVTSLDLIKEDSDDTDTKKETVVDLSGVNLQSAKATKNSINTFSNPNAMLSANRVLGGFKMGNEERYYGYAASVTCCLFCQDGTFYMGHTGNTRLYILRNSMLTQMTRDQTKAAELLNDGKIDLETYHVHPDRLVITDGLGILLKPHIQTLHGKLKENDIVLMSSDGLHYAIQPDAMAAIILESKDCMEASKNLIDASKNIIKYPDNMSAMVIYREKEE